MFGLTYLLVFPVGFRVGQTDSPLGNYLPLVGIYGVSFLTCFVSTLVVFFLYLKQKDKYIALTLLLSLLCFSAFLYRVSWFKQKQSLLKLQLFKLIYL